MILDVQVSAAGPAKLLDDMVGRLNNPRTMLGLLGRELEEYERDAFSSRGFGSWAADDSDTVQLKGSGRVLVDGGNLLRQLTRARVIGDTVVVDEGTAFYARFLRDGDRGMPRRNPAPKPTNAHVTKWADHLVQFITTGRS